MSPIQTEPLVVKVTADLHAEACLQVASGRILRFDADLVATLTARREQLLARLERGDAVYGVTTGMGAASTVRLDADSQSQQQENLMRARQIGSAPWLGEFETRVALVVRLRTLLGGDAGVSAELCGQLVDLLNHYVHPAIPSTRLGAAGEIIPLAHLGAVVIGEGRCLSGAGTDGETRATRDVLVQVGLEPYRLGPKEGVALIEGVPVTTARALAAVQQTRILGRFAERVLAAEFAVTGANRDPLRDSVIRGDDDLLAVARRVREGAGTETVASALQAPVSFRVSAPALAHLGRSEGALGLAAQRMLEGVTDSPAFRGDDFVGTAGFDGFELAAAFDALRVAIVHVAELSAARLHRLLDERVTGLPRQLSDRPGLHAGMVTVHKRAVGTVHELVRTSAPASLGAIETSLGQEDVQSFSLEAAAACAASIDGLRDVMACEMLAIVQARRLGGVTFEDVWEEIDGVVSAGTGDRAFGLDVEVLVEWLQSGAAGAVEVTDE